MAKRKNPTAESSSGLLLVAGAGIAGYLLWKHGTAAAVASVAPGVTTPPDASTRSTPDKPVSWASIHPQPPPQTAQPLPPVAPDGSAPILHPDEKTAGDTAYVTSLYRTLYKREPDPDGLDFWVKNLSKPGSTPQTVYDAFVASDEYKVLHSPGAQVSGDTNIPHKYTDDLLPRYPVDQIEPLKRFRSPRNYQLESERYQN